MIYIKRIEADLHGLKSTGSYVADIPLMRNFKPLEIDSPVTFIVGENGSGKSTLVEAIAVAAGFNPEGGSRNFNFATRESHSPFSDYLKLVRGPTAKWKDGYFLRAESFYNVATNIEELDSAGNMSPKISEIFGDQSLHEMSHGESFLALMKERFFGKGLYILDEPEAALSTTRLITMLHIMKELVENNSQFIISTHSPILTAFPGATIFQIKENGIEKCEWNKTDNYLVTKRFLDTPDFFIE